MPLSYTPHFIYPPSLLGRFVGRVLLVSLGITYRSDVGLVICVSEAHWNSSVLRSYRKAYPIN